MTRKSYGVAKGLTVEKYWGPYPGVSPRTGQLPGLLSPTAIVVSIMEEDTWVAVTLAFSVFPGHYYSTCFASLIACAWDRISLV